LKAHNLLAKTCLPTLINTPKMKAIIEVVCRSQHRPSRISFLLLFFLDGRSQFSFCHSSFFFKTCTTVGFITVERADELSLKAIDCESIDFNIYGESGY